MSEVKTLYVLMPGCIVFVGANQDTQAVISAVRIGRGNALLYEVCWWCGLDNKTAWLMPNEFTLKQGFTHDKIPIGFTP